jgi:hypothetical protein
MNRWKAVSLLLVMACGWLVPIPVWGAAGDPLWEKQFTFLPQYDTITINSTALSASRYILSGNARNADGTGGSLGFIKAFDVASGDIKWEPTLTLGDSNNVFGNIVINGDIALVRGSYATNSGSPPVFTVFKSFIRAYLADTGQQVWEVLRNFEVTSSSLPGGGNSTQTANNRVFTFFVPVSPSGTANYGTFYVRAYQVRNAALQTMLLLD